MGKTEYIKFLGFEMSIRSYFLTQAICMVLLAVLAAALYMRDSSGIWWKICLIGIPVEAVEAFLFSRKKRYTKD
jgi:hypothetical protein